MLKAEATFSGILTAKAFVNENEEIRNARYPARGSILHVLHRKRTHLEERSNKTSYLFEEAV